MTSITVSIHNQDSGEWDEYMHRCETATFYHQWRWRDVVSRTYKHKPYYLIAEKGSEIVGILPLFLMKSRFLGTFLLSVPFGDYGGICADNEEVAKYLLDKAISIADQTHAEYLELRYLRRTHPNLEPKTTRATLILELHQESDILWQKLKPKVRNQVRKAEKSGLTAQIGGIEYVTSFYKVFVHCMRDLGTPVHSLNFFKNWLVLFPQTNVITVELNGKTIGGGIATYFRDTMEIPWSASLRDYFQLCPNNLLYWEALKYGCEKGFRYFSFGRSPWESGPFKFKKQWGAEPITLYYEYYLNKQTALPDFSPSTNPKYDKATAIWKRLPVSLTRLIGPQIIKNIPY